MLAEVAEETGVHVHTLIGTMIEVPRAALIAGEIAKSAEFFSFGTNDLTQMGWGFSRDDVEGAFFSRYIELGIFGSRRSRPSTPTVSAGWSGSRWRRAGPPGPTWSSASAASTAATPTRCTSSTGRARLRVLLAVPGPGRPAGGWPRGGPGVHRRQRQQVTARPATTTTRRPGGQLSRRSGP